MPPIFNATRPIRASSIQKVIHERHKRRALSAGSHIRWTEIPNRRHSRSLGDHARFANLQRRSNAPAEKSRRHALMKNRLPVRPDQRNLPQRYAPSFARGDRRSRKLFADYKIKLADLSSGSRRPVRESQNRVSHGRGESNVMMFLELRRNRRRRP